MCVLPSRSRTHYDYAALVFPEMSSLQPVPICVFSHGPDNIYGYSLSITAHAASLDPKETLPGGMYKHCPKLHIKAYGYYQEGRYQEDYYIYVYLS